MPVLLVNSSTVSSRPLQGDGRPELKLGRGTSFFRARYTSFHIYSYCLILSLLLQSASVRQNTRAGSIFSRAILNGAYSSLFLLPHYWYQNNLCLFISYLWFLEQLEDFGYDKGTSTSY